MPLETGPRAGIKAAKAEAAGDLDGGEAYHQKSIALKDDAKAQWNRGIAANPKATDIHSNLGYAYAEANDLDSAERAFERGRATEADFATAPQ